MTLIRLAVIVYATMVVVIAGFMVWDNRSARPAYQTTRALGANHRIIAGDVRIVPGYHRGWDPFGRTIRDFEGRYIPRALASSQPVALDDLHREPQLTSADANTTLMWLPLATVSPPDVPLVEPGASADVCGLDDQQQPCVQGAQLAAQWCDPKAAATCFVGVWVPNDRRSALLKAMDAAPAARKPALHLVNLRRKG